MRSGCEILDPEGEQRRVRLISDMAHARLFRAAASTCALMLGPPDNAARPMSALTKEEQIEIAWAEHLTSLSGRAPGLTAALRDRLCEQQHGSCCYRGIRMDGIKGNDADAPTFEHIAPRGKGGSEIWQTSSSPVGNTMPRSDEVRDIHAVATE